MLSIGRSEAEACVQARSQKFAMGGGVAVLGVWGRSPQLSKILHCFAKITLFEGYFDKKIMFLKRGLKTGSANRMKLVA